MTDQDQRLDALTKQIWWSIHASVPDYGTRVAAIMAAVRKLVDDPLLPDCVLHHAAALADADDTRLATLCRRLAISVRSGAVSALDRCGRCTSTLEKLVREWGGEWPAAPPWPSQPTTTAK